MKIIDINEKEYPRVLRKIENPPKKLYVEGDEKILNSNCINLDNVMAIIT